MRKFARLCGVSFCLLGVFAATGFSAVVFQNVFDVPILGSDDMGNPSAENQGTGNGKIYKDADTGALYVVARGSAINEYKYGVRFRDQSFPIYDPWTQNYVPSSRDVVVLRRPINGNVIVPAAIVAVYLP